jgi:hypothetical protein
MLSLIQIEIMNKSEEKGPRDITPPKIEITSRELSFLGGISLPLPESMPSFFKEFHHMDTHCSLNLKLI